MKITKIETNDISKIYGFWGATSISYETYVTVTNYGANNVEHLVVEANWGESGSHTRTEIELEAGGTKTVTLSCSRGGDDTTMKVSIYFGYDSYDGLTLLYSIIYSFS